MSFEVQDFITSHAIIMHESDHADELQTNLVNAYWTQDETMLMQRMRGDVTATRCAKRSAWYQELLGW